MADIDYTKGQIYRNGVYYGGNGSSGSSVDVIDNLESEDPEKALSANMGRILNETKMESITTAPNSIIGTDKAGNVAVYSMYEHYLCNFCINIDGNRCASVSINARGENSITTYAQLSNRLYTFGFRDSTRFHPACGYVKMSSANICAVVGIYATSAGELFLVTSDTQPYKILENQLESLPNDWLGYYPMIETEV